MQTLIIIAGVSFIGSLVMLYQGVSRVRKGLVSYDGRIHPLGRLIGVVWKRMRFFLNYIAHAMAIVVSRLWARISFFVSKIYKNIVNKLERYFKHKNENNLDKDAKTQSILLTTIKAYKREIKKLKKTIEPDEMRPRNETEEEK